MSQPQGLERGWYATVVNTKTAPGNPFPGSAFNNKWTALGSLANPDAYTTGLVSGSSWQQVRAALSRSQQTTAERGIADERCYGCMAARPAVNACTPLCM